MTRGKRTYGSTGPHRPAPSDTPTQAEAQIILDMAARGLGWEDIWYSLDAEHRTRVSRETVRRLVLRRRT